MDSFPMPVCDFKRAKTSKPDLQWAEGSEGIATFGNKGYIFDNLQRELLETEGTCLLATRRLKNLVLA